MLGVDKNATDTDIKTAYKKLAMQLHPDKNRAPGAVEAFQILGNVMKSLAFGQQKNTYATYDHENDYYNQQYYREQEMLRELLCYICAHFCQIVVIFIEIAYEVICFALKLTYTRFQKYPNRE